MSIETASLTADDQPKVAEPEQDKGGNKTAKGSKGGKSRSPSGKKGASPKGKKGKSAKDDTTPTTPSGKRKNLRLFLICVSSFLLK